MKLPAWAKSEPIDHRSRRTTPCTKTCISLPAALPRSQRSRIWSLAFCKSSMGRNPSRFRQYRMCCGKKQSGRSHTINLGNAWQRTMPPSLMWLHHCRLLFCRCSTAWDLWLLKSIDQHWALLSAQQNLAPLLLLYCHFPLWIAPSPLTCPMQMLCALWTLWMFSTASRDSLWNTLLTVLTASRGCALPRSSC